LLTVKNSTLENEQSQGDLREGVAQVVITTEAIVKNLIIPTQVEKNTNAKKKTKIAKKIDQLTNTDLQTSIPPGKAPQKQLSSELKSMKINCFSMSQQKASKPSNYRYRIIKKRQIVNKKAHLPVITQAVVNIHNMMRSTLLCRLS
jgi:hypothetical protein